MNVQRKPVEQEHERRSGDRRKREPDRRFRELTELDDPVIRELQRQVREAKPHEPKPGDPDYLTPRQVARIKRERKEDQI
jgi:hypothetical protein